MSISPSMSHHHVPMSPCLPPSHAGLWPPPAPHHSQFLCTHAPPPLSTFVSFLFVCHMLLLFSEYLTREFFSFFQMFHLNSCKPQRVVKNGGMMASPPPCCPSYIDGCAMAWLHHYIWASNIVFIKHHILIWHFFLKADSSSSLLECTWALKKLSKLTKTCVVGKCCLQRPIEVDLPCIQENGICDIFTWQVTCPWLPC